MKFIKSLICLYFVLAMSLNLSAQCNFAAGSGYGSGVAPTGCAPVTLTTCAYYNEYSTVTTMVAGTTYTFTASASPSVSGPFTFGVYNSNVIGTPPVAWTSAAAYPMSITYTPSVSGTYYVSCFYGGGACSQTSSTCHTYTVSCSSCTAPPPAGVQPSTAPVAQNSINNQVLRVDLTACAASTVTALNLSTSGSTYPVTDITAAKVYYTTTPTFSTLNQFGSTINNPNGAMVFSGSASINSGATGYFWLVYDIAPGALIGNVVDAYAFSITSNSVPITVVPANPTGNRTIQGVPSNDNCSNAIDLTVNSGDICYSSQNGNTYFATQSSETAPTCSTTGINDDVWYKFTATSTTHFISVNYSDNATTTQVYSGACGSLVAVSCFAGSYGNSNILLTTLTPGNTYYVRVYSTTSTAGTYSNFNICVSTPSVPTNGNCASAIELPCGGSVAGNNALAGVVTLPGSTCGITSAAQHGVWFTVTPTTSGNVTIDACGSLFDNYLRVYSGTCANLTCVSNTSGVGYADAGCPIALNNAAKLTFPGVAGTTYYVLFTSYSVTQSGEYHITATCPLSCTGSPSALIAYNITAHEASVSWTASSPAPVSGYQYYYSTSSTPPDNMTVPSGTTTNTYVDLTGLISNTTYYFWVQAYCFPGDASPWVALPTFTTLIPSDCEVTISATPNPTCPGGNINLATDGSWIAWNWAGPNGWTSTSANPVLANAQPIQSGTYSVTVTAADLCTAVDFETVIINPNPTATASASPNPICVGKTLQLNASGGASYNWSGPSGFSSSSQNPTRVNIQTTHAGTYIVTVTSAAGCTSTASVNVTVYPNPTATATATPNPICAGGTLQLGATGGTSYSWSGPGSFSSSLQNPTRTNIQTSHAGIYTVTVTSSTGCTSTATISVTVNPKPSVSVSATPNPVCQGELMWFAASGGVDYHWSGPGGFTFEKAEFGRHMEPSMGGVYYVTVTSSEGCTATGSVTATVKPAPVATISINPNPACSGNNVQLSASGGISYKWSGPNGFTSTQQNPVLSNVKLYHSGTYSVTVTGANSCTASISSTLKVNETPVGKAWFDTKTACTGSTLQLYADGGGTYQWTGPAGFSSAQQNPTRANLNASHSGIYTVVITGLYGGCTSSYSVNVQVHPLPTVTAWTTTPEVCEGDAAYLFASGGSSYKWSGPYGYSSNFQNPIIYNIPTYLDGSYTVTASSEYGCTASATVFIDVQSVNAIVNATPNPVPYGGTLYLTASGGTFYLWTGPNGFHTNMQNPIIYKFTSVNAGLYACVVSTSAGCQDTEIILVQVKNQNAQDEPQLETRSGRYVQAFPNPAKDVIHLDDNYTGTMDYTILNTQGDVIQQGKTTSGDQISIDQLNAGSYYIQWTYTVDGKLQSNISKFIKVQ